MSDVEYRCPSCAFELWLPLVNLRVSTLGLYDDARFPGRCLLVLNEHHEDVAELPDDLAVAFLQDTRKAAQAIRTVASADRMNYAILGNALPHVHVHLIPRVFAGDPIRNQAPWETLAPHAKLPEPQRHDLSERLRRSLALHERTAS